MPAVRYSETERLQHDRESSSGAPSEPTFEEVLALQRAHATASAAAPVAGSPASWPSLAGDDPLVQLSVRVPSSVRERIRAAADHTGVSTQSFVLEAVRAQLRRVEGFGTRTPGLAQFADELVDLIRSGTFREEVDLAVGLDPDLRV